MTDNIIALTGHRANKLPNLQLVRTKTEAEFFKQQPSLVITGMANGFDLIAGNIALDMEIPIVCAKPWRGHGPNKGDEEAYARLIKYADEVVNVVDQETFPGNWCYHKRNEWMVDHANYLIVYWDGAQNGGTYACWRYAKSKGMPHTRIDPIG